MVEVEIDGQKVQVPPGSMVLQAASKLGIYIPHFCFHKKLSIAANCRMCLVDVEKAPKALPACATPVSPGMKIMTASDKARKAQQAVMEFLLINHPLDCPICDQGGECQLQDLAVGYGGSTSRYREEKRVVFHKSLGPLVSAEEMSRCIHCTRCVRFGQEVAGVMELGMNNRGQHSEIASFVGRSVDSELSGNMIDLCPVGALTSKPFRYAARTWELSRRRSVAAHDALGSNIVVQVKHDKVLRVVPLENEAVNECWLSDRDRFAYEGLNSAERLQLPMIRRDGQWEQTDWSTALTFAADALGSARNAHGPSSIGVLASEQSSLEELHMLAEIARGLGGVPIDTRLRQIDFSLDAVREGAPWLGMPIAEVNTLQRLVLIGSFLRKDQPLLAARVRAAVKRGLAVSVIHAVDDDLLMPLAHKAILAPSQWPLLLAVVLKQLRSTLALEARPMPAVDPELKNWVDQMASSSADPAVAQLGRSIAQALQSGDRKAVWLGSAARHHPHYGRLHALAQAITLHCGAVLGELPEGANGVGAWQVGACAASVLGARRGAGAAQSAQGAVHAAQLMAEPRKAYLLYQVEPELDHAAAAACLARLKSAHRVIVMGSYCSEPMLGYADCLLPIAPYTESSGTLVNMEGRRQAYAAVVKPLGQARPGWKALRVLADLLQIPGLGFESVEEVRRAAIARADAYPLSNHCGTVPGLFLTLQPVPVLERVAEVPIYATDPVVRRAESLQSTRDARPAVLRAHPDTLAQLGARDGARLRIVQGEGEAILPASADLRVAPGVLRIPAALPATMALAASAEGLGATLA